MILKCLDSLLHAHLSYACVFSRHLKYSYSLRVQISLSSSTMPMIVLKSAITGDVLVEEENFALALHKLLETLPTDTIFQIIPESTTSAIIVVLPGPAKIAYQGPHSVLFRRPRPEFDPMALRRSNAVLNGVPTLNVLAPKQCSNCLSICSDASWQHNQWRCIFVDYGFVPHPPRRMYHGKLICASWVIRQPFQSVDFGHPLSITALNYNTPGCMYLCHACVPRVFPGMEYKWSCRYCRRPYFDTRVTDPGARLMPTRGERIDFIWCSECVKNFSHDSVAEISSDSD